MNYFYSSLSVENLKIRRSKVLLFGFFGCIFISFMMGFLMFISLHPEIAKNSSLIGTKASFFTATNWESYFSVLMQMSTALSFAIFGFLTTWMFGREYSDRTLKDILSLPVSRTTIIISKFIIVSFWSFIISLVLFFASIAVGLLLQVQDWSNELFFRVFVTYLITIMLVLAVTTPVAFISCIGKGYLVSFVYIFSGILTAQFINIGLPGLDPYVPWIIPVIFATSSFITASNLPPLNIFSYLIIMLTFAIGFSATIYWWRNVDQF